MEGRPAVKPERCAHCDEAVAAPVEWRCKHGRYCNRCFYEHLQPSARVARQMREEAAREARALARLALLPKAEPGGVPVLFYDAVPPLRDTSASEDGIAPASIAIAT